MKKIFACLSLGLASASYAESRNLIGSSEADIKDFPASISAQFPLEGGYGSCTATIVGPQALLIASHCVSDNPNGSFTVGANKYKIACTMTDLYRRGTDHDLALCKIDHAVTGVVFENVNLNAAIVQVGDTLQLTGYGCVFPNGSGSGSGGNDGVYRIGEAKVQTLPNSTYSFDYVTIGKSALCQGDSGGPAFKYLDAQKKYRVVVSANSKGNIQDTSYLASTSTPESVNFIKTWAKNNNVLVCGVHADAPGCRPFADVTPKTPDGGSTACPASVIDTNLIAYRSCLIENTMSVSDCDKVVDSVEECRARKN